MTTTDPAVFIPAAPTVEQARGLYADGFRSAVAAMRILAPGLDVEQMARHVARNIIPVGGRERTDYEHGQSEAFVRWQQNRRVASRTRVGAR